MAALFSAFGIPAVLAIMAWLGFRRWTKLSATARYALSIVLPSLVMASLFVIAQTGGAQFNFQFLIVGFVFNVVINGAILAVFVRLFPHDANR
jgi:hypothetical protein